jgi:hypothetical protein
LNQDERHFIETYVLKSGEELESNTDEQSDSHFIDWQIIKRTERTYRVVGLVTMAANWNESEMAHDDLQQLLKKKPTPTKKLQLADHDPATIRWFDQGWIIKEIRLKKDGKTPDAQHFRMGYRLYQYLQDVKREKEAKWEQEFSKIKNKVVRLCQVQTGLLARGRAQGVQACLTTLNELCSESALQLKHSPVFPSSWPIAKRLKFLHFLVAFLNLSLQQSDFDWKEIGASYYQEIGGSKQFDLYKDEFIDKLETLAQVPAGALGLTSLGKITPLYFSGQLQGRYSSYAHGPVHALTDLSVAEEKYATEAQTLWLVENRAVLTRFAAETDFLKNTNSFMLCIDGHLRSAHRNFIDQLLTNSRAIKQVIIWTDYDPDGLLIARELYQTVANHGLAVLLKWITTEHEVLASWQEYEQYMREFLKSKKMEQEEVLGGADDWKKWISH